MLHMHVFKKSMFICMIVCSMVLIISACGTNEDNANQNTENHVFNSNDENTELNKKRNNNNDNEDNTNNNNNDEGENEEKSDTLSEYSDDEIEYARIWLQLGDTQEINELNVHKMSAGTPLNPDDESSVDYPEDVVQLRGESVAEGSITYSSNGDGTITVYNKIPARWDGENPAGKETYEKILDDKEEVSIDTGDDNKEIEDLIKKLNIHK